MSFSKEIKVGLLAIAALLVLYGGFNYFKGKPIFDKTNLYYALYNSTEGLSTANAVNLNGCPVGRIRHIAILPAQGYKVLVTLSVDKKVKLTHTTVARLESSGLLGGKSIDLLIKEGQELQNKDTLLTEIMPSLTDQFNQQVLPTLQEAKSLTLSTSKFMQNLVENTERINTIFLNLEKTSSQLHQVVHSSYADLHTISRNMADISGTLSDPVVGVRPLLSKLKDVMEEVEQLQVNESVSKVNSLLTKLEGNTLMQVDQTLIDLDKLLADMRENPKRYLHFSVFGAESIFRRAPKEKEKPAAE